MRQHFILFTLLIVGSIDVAFAQDLEIRESFNNNHRSIIRTINKSSLVHEPYVQDPNAPLVYGGILFEATFSRTGVDTNDFLKLEIDGIPLLSFSIKGRRFVVKHQVIWRECTSWTEQDCTQWGNTQYGESEYLSWDDELVPLNSGSFSVLVSDNGIQIKISNAEHGGSSIYDLSYSGLWEAGIERRILESSESDVLVLNLEIPAASAALIQLTDLHLEIGNVAGVELVTPELDPQGTGERNPHTEYTVWPGGGNRVAVQKPSEEIVLASGDPDPADGQVSLFPNPVSGDLFLKTSLPTETTAQLLMYDLQGRPVFTQDHVLPAGTNVMKVPIDRSRMPTGLVIYELKYGNALKRGKLLIE